MIRKVDSRTGQTPLHTAARLGCLAALRALVAGGAGLEDKDEHGRTALMVRMACKLRPAAQGVRPVLAAGDRKSTP